MHGKHIIHLNIPWKNIELGYIISLILKTLTLVISNMLYPHIFILYVDNLTMYHVVYCSFNETLWFQIVIIQKCNPLFTVDRVSSSAGLRLVKKMFSIDLK